jgi:hypothetical protein
MIENGGKSSMIAQDTSELVTLMQNLLMKDPVERVVGECWGK